MKNLHLRGMWGKLAPDAPQFGIVAFGICALLLVEWMLETRLVTTANGTHFATADGRMAEAGCPDSLSVRRVVQRYQPQSAAGRRVPNTSAQCVGEPGPLAARLF
jgi:hypothetical protein